MASNVLTTNSHPFVISIEARKKETILKVQQLGLTPDQYELLSGQLPILSRHSILYASRSTLSIKGPLLSIAVVILLNAAITIGWLFVMHIDDNHPILNRSAKGLALIMLTVILLPVDFLYAYFISLRLLFCLHDLVYFTPRGVINCRWGLLDRVDRRTFPYASLLVKHVAMISNHEAEITIAQHIQSSKSKKSCCYPYKCSLFRGLYSNDIVIAVKDYTAVRLLLDSILSQQVCRAARSVMDAKLSIPASGPASINFPASPSLPDIRSLQVIESCELPLSIYSNVESELEAASASCDMSLRQSVATNDARSLARITREREKMNDLRHYQFLFNSWKQAQIA